MSGDPKLPRTDKERIMALEKRLTVLEDRVEELELLHTDDSEPTTYPENHN
jgi:hypothetical protein